METKTVKNVLAGFVVVATVFVLSILLYLIGSDHSSKPPFCHSVPDYVMQILENEENSAHIEKKDKIIQLIPRKIDTIPPSVQGSPRFLSKIRSKRSDSGNEPWKCEAQFRTVFLGSDYFPEVHREAVCGGTCFDGRFKCVKGAAVQVRVLRKVSPQCPPLEPRILRAVKQHRIEPFIPGFDWDAVYIVKHCECLASY